MGKIVSIRKKQIMLKISILSGNVHVFWCTSTAECYDTISHCYLCSRSLSRLLLSSLVIANVPVRMLVNLVFKTCNSSNIIDTIVTELFGALVIVIIAWFLQLKNRRTGALPWRNQIDSLEILGRNSIQIDWDSETQNRHLSTPKTMSSTRLHLQRGGGTITITDQTMGLLWGNGKAILKSVMCSKELASLCRKICSQFACGECDLLLD